MSSASESNGRQSDPQAEEGVLANLPRTRLQRSSPRRTAARKASAAAGMSGAPRTPSRADSKQASVSATKPTPTTPRAKATPKAKTKVKTTPKAKLKAAPAKARIDESVPRQGFESEMDRATGPVQPPDGADLVSSAAEIFSELARAGLSTGERLLKDALGRLPL
jgi:hypothetical protein